jgi:hypothetical protein
MIVNMFANNNKKNNHHPPQLVEKDHEA